MRKTNTTNEPSHKWLTNKEAADYLGISVATLWRYRTAGQIGFAIRRNKPVYHVDELDRFNRPKQPYELA